MYCAPGRCVHLARTTVAVGTRRALHSCPTCEGGSVAVRSTSWHGSSCTSFSRASLGRHESAVMAVWHSSITTRRRICWWASRAAYERNSPPLLPIWSALTSSTLGNLLRLCSSPGTPGSHSAALILAVARRTSISSMSARKGRTSRVTLGS